MLISNARHTITRVMGGIDLLSHWVDRILQALLVGVLAAIFLLMFSQVILRYVIHSPFAWIEEVAAYMLPVLALWGAAVCIRHGSHLQVDMLLQALPGPLRSLLVILIQVMIVYFALKVSQSGLALMELGRNEMSTSRTFSLYWPRMTIVIGGALIMFQSTVLILKEMARLMGAESEIPLENETETNQ